MAQIRDAAALKRCLRDVPTQEQRPAEHQQFHRSHSRRGFSDSMTGQRPFDMLADEGRRMRGPHL